MNLSSVAFPVITVSFDLKGGVWTEYALSDGDLKKGIAESCDHNEYLTHFTIYDTCGNAYHITDISVKKRSGLWRLLGDEVNVQIERSPQRPFDEIRQLVLKQLVRLEMESDPDVRSDVRQAQSKIRAPPALPISFALGWIFDSTQVSQQRQVDRWGARTCCQEPLLALIQTRSGRTRHWTRPGGNVGHERNASAARRPKTVDGRALHSYVTDYDSESGGSIMTVSKSQLDELVAELQKPRPLLELSESNWVAGAILRRAANKWSEGDKEGAIRECRAAIELWNVCQEYVQLAKSALDAFTSDSFSPEPPPQRTAHCLNNYDSVVPNATERLT